MPSQQSNKLASQIPDKLRSYRGPLDLAWVVSVAQRWQQVASAPPSGVDPSVALHMLLDLDAWIERDP